MAIQKKESWTEEELIGLPDGEQDYFERKSGAVLVKPSPEDVIAKALGAFANSGGGHLILGVADDGAIDGVPALKKGRQSTKDWLEQVIPYYLNYPLQDFRVHEVIRADPSAIPPDRVVIIIDVGDSALAPHQTAKSKNYYYRSGGRSEPAPHFYLDVLWGRQSFPSAKVARVWLDNVIRTALSVLNDEIEMIRRGRWTWDVSDKSIPGTFSLSPPNLLTGANAEQFFESYPSLRALLRPHDEALSKLEKSLDELSTWITDVWDVEEVYARATRPESLEELRGIPGASRWKIDTDADVLSAVFTSLEPINHLKVIADLLINQRLPPPDRPLLRAFWEKHGASFTKHVRLFASYNRISREIESHWSDFSEAVGELHAAFTQTRRELAVRHGEPYETML